MFEGISDIEVDSIYYYLKKNGYTLAKVEQLKDEIWEILPKQYKNIYRMTDKTEKELLWYSLIYTIIYINTGNLEMKNYILKNNGQT